MQRQISSVFSHVGSRRLASPLPSFTHAARRFTTAGGAQTGEVTQTPSNTSQAVDVQQNRFARRLAREQARTLGFTDPFGVFRNVDRLFEPFGFELPRQFARDVFDLAPIPQSSSFVVDFHEEKDKYVLSAEVPGIPKENIKVELNGNLLTIRGEKTEEHTETEKDFIRRERIFGTFIRRVQLPEDANVASLKANHSHGVLKVEVPKVEKALPKEIQID